jgi:hypothetical protein
MTDANNPFGQFAPPPKRSSSVWIWVVLIILLVLGLICAGLCGGGWLLFSHRVAPQLQKALQEGMGQAVAMQLAIQRLQGSVEVTAQLGAPIETQVRSINVSMRNGESSVRCGLEASGPKGKATVDFDAESSGGTWNFKVFQVTFADGQTLDLSGPAELQMDDEAADESPEEDEAMPEAAGKTEIRVE